MAVLFRLKRRATFRDARTGTAGMLLFHVNQSLSPIQLDGVIPTG